MQSQMMTQTVMQTNTLRLVLFKLKKFSIDFFSE
jgi:hypothetical protein